MFFLRHKKLFRLAIIASILTGSTFVFYLLASRFIAAVYLSKADKLLNDQSWEPAKDYLKQAWLLFPENDSIVRKYGDACYYFARKQSAPSISYPLFKEAHNSYLEAVRLNSWAAINHYRLARCEWLMAHYFDFSPNNSTIYSPLTHFKQAVKLRPNGVTYRYGLVTYLADIGDTQNLSDNVRKLVYSFPSVVNRLKKEEFWSDGLMQASVQGLEKAFAGGVHPQAACEMLSQINSDLHDYDQAISYYLKSLSYLTVPVAWQKKLHLGFLFLKKGEWDKTFESFFHGLLESPKRDQALQKIYSYFRQEKQIQGYLDFFELAEKRIGFSKDETMIYVQSLIGLKKYDQAKGLLKKMPDKNSDAEIWFQLGRIAEYEKDWDAMEVAAQKATLYRPNNINYQWMFCRVLVRMGKYERAEKASDATIRLSGGGRPNYYHYRSTIRERLGNYTEALADMEKAIQLKEEYAPYYVRAAELSRKLSNKKQVVFYYERAIKLAPEKKQYQQQYKKALADI